ncbi:uncharacterized protein LOC133173102 [Saccostrea echinata]|uniref:uncharacterized protein LOC133173102 n=1 Tax=Saccostrea echinata TaxID=191078 RepID=UPI002A7EC743|nr:uncharacterized protein LOC133173102 [Saccostrea echinata]
MFGRTLVAVFLFVTVSNAFVVDMFRDLVSSCSDAKKPTNPVQDVSQTCLENAASGSCNFYDCFEQRFPCGNCGFSKHYGTYDCEKFYQPVYYNQFNDLGKRWIKATGDCLINTLKQFYTQDTVRCRMIKTTMMDHVSTCYLHNAANISFCDVFWDNRDALMGVYEASSFLQPTEIHRVLFEVLQIGTSCTGNRASEFRTLITERLTPVVSQAGSRLQEVGRQIGSRLEEAGRQVGNWFNNIFSK